MFSVIAWSSINCQTPTWVVGLWGSVQQTEINASKMEDVVQRRDHHPPNCDNQTHDCVDQEEQVRQEEQTLSGGEKKKRSRLKQKDDHIKNAFTQVNREKIWFDFPTSASSIKKTFHQ